jgi:hypothetical protein
VSAKAEAAPGPELPPYLHLRVPQVHDTDRSRQEEKVRSALCINVFCLIRNNITRKVARILFREPP